MLTAPAACRIVVPVGTRAAFPSMKTEHRAMQSPSLSSPLRLSASTAAGAGGDRPLLLQVLELLCGGCVRRIQLQHLHEGAHSQVVEQPPPVVQSQMVVARGVLGVLGHDAAEGLD